MRNAYIVLTVTTAGFLIFLLGDYLAWFGTSKTTTLDYIQVDFRTVDEVTGAPVMEVRARCFQKNNRNACSVVDSGKPGILSLKIPLHKIITRSHLFRQGEEMVETADPKLHIMFVHYDYASPVETIMTRDLPSLAGQQLTVSMPRRIGSGNTEADEQE